MTYVIDTPELVALVLLTAAAGLIGYVVLRIKPAKCSRPSAAIGGVINILFASLLLHVFGISPPARLFLILPVSLVTAFLIALAAMGVRAIWNAPVATTPAGHAEDQGVILKMLADGKVSAAEASALLDACGDPATPADARPPDRLTKLSIIGNFIVLVGFMLPWSVVRIRSAVMGLDVTGFQTGRDAGFLGWLVLTIAVLPTILACLPSLDRHVRQAMLRLCLSAAGALIVATLGVQILIFAKAIPGIGLFTVLAGFLIQITASVRASGFFRTARRDGPESR